MLSIKYLFILGIAKEHRIPLLRIRCMTDKRFKELKKYGSGWGESPCRQSPAQSQMRFSCFVIMEVINEPVCAAQAIPYGRAKNAKMFTDNH
jgi:hypothetical protein